MGEEEIGIFIASANGRLVDDNQRTKAACWAYFAGEDGLAGTILMRSDGEFRLTGVGVGCL